MNTICPSCEEYRDVDVIVATEEMIVKGVPISASVVHSRCTVCSEEFSTPSKMAESLDNAYNEFDLISHL